MPLSKESTLLRVGILGCGPISQFAHLEAVQKGRNVMLAAVCDRDEGLAHKFGSFYAAEKIYTDYEAMLADETVDAVIIATSDAFHVPASRKALMAGKHVFCEKPIGLSVEEVEALQTDVKCTGKVLQIGHMLRFDPGIQSAYDFINTDMGQMLALKAWYCDSTHRYTVTDAIQALAQTGKNALRPAGDQKANKHRYNMLAHGSHLVDLARYLGGPIRAVQTRQLDRYGSMCWFVDVDFESGALGHLDLTLQVRMDWHEGFQIYGEYGSVLAKIFNPWFYKASEVDIFREADGAYHRTLGADGHFYRRQVEAFADVVLKGLPMTGASIEDGLASVRAMVAIAQSAQSGKPVDLASVEGAV
ncbi:Predicted dehydrogenase [Thiothrix eikelboomii]|uniref:Predicted dehydrogenase n=1 Tax=Thiothrix eikelboomii TaxID=92487 RepID=A0A1T4X081_9GAMM|nr:Gfo/Idh/MocA family oxidoreductase [Thiothrix eikelboomii]SKA82899.1 Predicted dehydrogenase [Thiothrix eikelboomii]